MAFKNYGIFISFLFIVGLVFFTSCEQNSTTLEDSLSIVSDLEPVKGTENASIKLKEGDQNNSYFTIEFDNLGRNNVLQNGEREAWCIEWNKPSRLNTIISDTDLFDTRGSEKFKTVNYLLNIKDELMESNTNITFREIQVAMWILLGELPEFPEFDLSNLNVRDLPERMRNDDQLLFDTSLVNEIVNIVKTNVNNFEYDSGQEFAVVTSTSSDDQTVITLGDETMWAWGQFSFRGDVILSLCDATADDPNQWGWVIEFDPNVENPKTTDLLAGAGQDDGDDTAAELINKGATDVGDLEISLSGTTLTVTYTAHDPFEFNDLHLWVGCSLSQFCEVVNSGDNSPPGQFPYAHQVAENFTSHTFTIDISTLNCSSDVLYISAHGGEAVGPVEAFNSN